MSDDVQVGDVVTFEAEVAAITDCELAVELEHTARTTRFYLPIDAVIERRNNRGRCASLLKVNDTDRRCLGVTDHAGDHQWNGVRWTTGEQRGEAFWSK